MTAAREGSERRDDDHPPCDCCGRGARPPLTPEDHTVRPLTEEEYARRATLLHDVRHANRYRYR